MVKTKSQYKAMSKPEQEAYKAGLSVEQQLNANIAMADSPAASSEPPTTTTAGSVPPLQATSVDVSSQQANIPLALQPVNSIIHSRQTSTDTHMQSDTDPFTQNNTDTHTHTDTGAQPETPNETQNSPLNPNSAINSDIQNTQQQSNMNMFQQPQTQSMALTFDAFQNWTTEFMKQFNSKFDQQNKQFNEKFDQQSKQFEGVNGQLAQLQQSSEIQNKQLSDLRAEFRADFQTHTERLDTMGARLDSLQENIETRFAKLEEANNNLANNISQEVDKQLDSRTSQVETYITNKFSGVQSKVTEQILKTVDTRLGTFSAELNVCSETVKNLTPSVDSLSETLSTLRIKQDSMEEKLTSLDSRVGNVLASGDEQVKQFIKSTEEKFNKHINAEIFNHVDDAAAKVYKAHSVDIQALSEDVRSLKNMLSKRQVTVPREQDGGLVTDSRRPDNVTRSPPTLPDTERSLPTSTRYDIDRTNFRQTDYGHYDHHDVPEHPSQCRTESQIASILLEESMIKHHQFPVFIHECKTVHPVVFIRSFRDILPTQWSDKRKIRFVVGYIQGESAIWGSNALQEFDSFSEFEHAFLYKFWSPAMQERLRNEVTYPQPFNPKNGSLRRYFEKYINKTKFFDEPLPHQEVLRVLVSHLPSYLQMHLSHVPVSNLEYFLSVVDKIDLIIEHDRARNPPTHFNNSSKHAGGNFPTPQPQYVNIAHPPPQFQPPHASVQAGVPIQHQQIIPINGANGNYFNNNNGGNGGGAFRKKKRNRYNPGYQHSNLNNYQNTGYYTADQQYANFQNLQNNNGNRSFRRNGGGRKQHFSNGNNFNPSFQNQVPQFVNQPQQTFQSFQQPQFQNRNPNQTQTFVTNSPNNQHQIFPASQQRNGQSQVPIAAMTVDSTTSQPCHVTQSSPRSRS